MITLIKNATLFDPQPQGLKDVLITGGKVSAVLECSENNETNLPLDWNIEVIDLKGSTLVPGFIDCHTHITGGGGEAGFATQVPPVPLSQFTQCGVTTVVGLLGTDDTTRSTENLVARVYGLREEGMSAFCWTGGYHYPLTTLTGSAKSDIVFLDPVIGIGEFAISDHRSSQPTYEEIIRIASEAYVAGLMTGKAGVIHFHLGDGDRKLELITRAIRDTELPAKVFHPTHVNRNKPLFDESCQLLELGGYIDITAFPEGTDDEGYSAIEAIQLAISRQLPIERITMSSDGGGCLPCFDLKGELQSMDFGRSSTLIETIQKAYSKGIKLEQVLPMVTSNIAKLLKLNAKGSIAVGYDADLVVLNKDMQVTDVMALGKWHRRDQAAKIVGCFE